MDLRSENNLVGVHPDLVRVTRLAYNLSPIKFIVIEGLRTAARAAQLRRQGKSWTKRSKHMTGHAVDVMAVVPKGEDPWHLPHYRVIADAFRRAAKQLGVPMRHGIDWVQVDAVHHELEGRPPLHIKVAKG